MSILKRQVYSSWIFASFFIVRTNNSLVNFKLTHFLLWINESKVPILRLSSTLVKICQILHSIFQTTIVFLQILHHSLASWKITPLYFFRSNTTGKDQSKSNFLRLLGAWIKIHQIFVIFEKTNQFSFNCFHQAWLPSNITPLYFLIFQIYQW